MIGIQFQGEKHINVPLVLTHYRGDPDFKPLIMPSNQWQRFHQYIASVAVDSERNLLCVTTPIGGCAAIYDSNTRMLIDAVRLPDCAGASLFAGQVSGQAKNKDGTSGFIVSDGHGKLTRLWVNTLSVETSDLAELDSKNTAAIIVQDSQIHNMSFDNHLQAVLA